MRRGSGVKSTPRASRNFQPKYWLASGSRTCGNLSVLASATSFPASSDNPHHIAGFAIGIFCHYAFIRVVCPTESDDWCPMVNVATAPDILYLVEKRLRLTASSEIRNVSRCFDSRKVPLPRCTRRVYCTWNREYGRANFLLSMYTYVEYPSV